MQDAGVWVEAVVGCKGGQTTAAAGGKGAVAPSNHWVPWVGG
jgi:hypothetical protein